MASEKLSELQLAFVQALWELGEGSVAQVQEVLEREGRKLAPTTVATVLRRLEAQGWVSHREQGRSFIYKATVSHKRAAGRMLTNLTRSLFGGDLPALVSHLLESHKVDRREIEEIRRLIADKERRLK
ncbi:MAG TPA: BlaI/MecI/CopY family transcriptional regulator [Polyangia bacterium]|nr:BlaI/MecI/CopY family transcriptional regulator [Polyangia bacterium]